MFKHSMSLLPKLHQCFEFFLIIFFFFLNKFSYQSSLNKSVVFFSQNNSFYSPFNFEMILVGIFFPKVFRRICPLVAPIQKIFGYKVIVFVSFITQEKNHRKMNVNEKFSFAGREIF